MKIDNSRIFTADIYQVVNGVAKDEFNWGDCVVGNYEYDTIQETKGTVFVYFEGKGYVPVGFLKNIALYAGVKFLNKSKFVLNADLGPMPENGTFFVKNVQKLFQYPGQTTLKELLAIQKLQFDRDDAYSGGMEYVL